MVFVLFPNRHLCFTRAAESALAKILGGGAPLCAQQFVGGELPPALPQNPTASALVLLITSANMENSRWDPLPLHVRAVLCDRFAAAVSARKKQNPLSCSAFAMPAAALTDRFAALALSEITEQTEGDLVLTPANCVVFASPAGRLCKQFRSLGFGVVDSDAGSKMAPFELIARIAEKGEACWSEDAEIVAQLSTSSFSVLQDFPWAVRHLSRLFTDPLLTDAGSLTLETRDYASYSWGMSNPAVIQFKLDDIREAIVTNGGRIADEGCADGALLVLLARHFPDADLLGVEIAQEFLAECRERQRQGQFGSSFVHFHQRNLCLPVFQRESIDTTICASTTHEIWSYGHQEESMVAYLKEKFAQTRSGGRLIIRDVVGPENGDMEVLLWCNDADGITADAAAKSEKLEQLSTAARFVRFAEDFLAAQRAKGNRGDMTKIMYSIECIKDETYFVLPLRSAAEFMLKKDYTTNWDCEMNEEFCHWSFMAWKRRLTDAGFSVIEGGGASGSRVYTSEWIAKNRLHGKTALFCRGPGASLLPLELPPTNVVLVAEKPRK